MKLGSIFQAIQEEESSSLVPYLLSSDPQPKADGKTVPFTENDTITPEQPTHTEICNRRNAHFLYGLYADILCSSVIILNKFI